MFGYIVTAAVVIGFGYFVYRRFKARGKGTSGSGGGGIKTPGPVEQE